MTRKTSKTIFSAGAALALGISSSFAGAPDKNPPPISVTESAWTQPLLGGGVKTSDTYTDGNIFLTLPLWSTIGQDGTLGGDYLFIEPYSSVGEGGEVAASLGLSWRHLFSHEPTSALQKKGSAGFNEEGWFLGGSFFLDMLDTQHHNAFWQLGFGAEVGNRYVELRGNYYVPLTDRKLAERNVSERSSTSASTRYVQSGSGYGDPYATGNQIAQDVNLTTSAITTYRTTTVRTVTEIFEKGMQGWDAEASVLLPWLDKWVDVRLIGGYFSFDNQPFGPQSYGTGKVHGWKAGVEFRPVPAVVLTGMWYEDKRLTGGHWLVGVQLQVPLDKTWRDAFTPRRRHLVEHLAEPVHRQNDAIKIGNEEEQHSTSTTSTRRVTRVVSQEQGHIVLADDLIFVNNGPAVGNGIQAGNPADTGTGTAENPTYTVQHGANIAGVNNASTGRVWNVYTQGGGATGTYAESVAVKGSTNFISSFTAIAGQGGRIFGGNTPRPMMNGGFIAQNIGYVGITGYEITSGLSSSVPSVQNSIVVAGQGIFFDNVAKGLIKANFIHDVSSSGIYAEAHAGVVSTLLVAENTISKNGGNGIEARTLDGANGTFNLENNVLSVNSFNGFAGSASQDSTGNFNLTGNTITANVSGGVSLFAENNSIVTTSMTGNTVKDQPGDGLFLKGIDDSNFTSAVIANNTFTNTGSRAINILVDDLPGSTPKATLHITGNTITNPGSDGIYILAQKTGASINVTALDNNTITDAGITSASIANGITLRAESGAQITAPDISGNTITNSRWNGIEFYADGAAPTILTANVTGNIFHTAGNDYIHTESHTAATLTVTANNNTFSSATNDAIHAQSYDQSTTNFTATGNIITNQGGSGIVFEAFDPVVAGSTFNGTITGNTITNPGSTAISLSANGVGTTMHITALDDNTLTQSGSSSDSIFIATYSGASVTADSISRNTIANAGQNGMTFYATGTGGTLTAGNVTGNTITNSGANGIKLYSANTSTIDATINGNTITGSANNAIWADSYNIAPPPSPIALTPAITLSANNNTIGVANGWIGINMRTWNGAVSTLTATGNTITGGTGGFGTYLALFTNSAGGQSGSNVSFLTATLSGNTITGGTGFNGFTAQSNETTVLNTTITGNTITTGDNGQGILTSSGNSSKMTFTVGGNTIGVGAGTANGIRFDVFSAIPMKVNVGIPPVDNTITKGAGLFLKTTGSFGAGSTIQINGTTLTPPSNF